MAQRIAITCFSFHLPSLIEFCPSLPCTEFDPLLIHPFFFYISLALFYSLKETAPKWSSWNKSFFSYVLRAESSVFHIHFFLWLPKSWSMSFVSLSAEASLAIEFPLWRHHRPFEVVRLAISVSYRFAWVCQDWLGFTGFYRVLPGFTGFYWVLLSFAGFPLVARGFSGLDSYFGRFF